MNVKYQIFVSSTYEDLKKEREQVVKAILEMGHIPIGMEMFSAADEGQWQIIARQIEQTDYYVVIVAHRYGSMEQDISYTEKEYDYAVERGVPVLGFVIDEAARWPSNLMDEDDSAKTALKHFKEKIKRKMVSFWTSLEDLHGKVSIALIKEINANPRVGWLPSSQVASPEMSAELARLNAENAKLRDQLQQALSKKEDERRVEMLETLRILGCRKVRLNLWFAGKDAWSDQGEIEFIRIFHGLAAHMIDEMSVEDLSLYLGCELNVSSKPLRPHSPIPRNTLKTWLAELNALGLVEPSKKTHLANDTNEYWTLTDKGRQIFSDLTKRILVNQSTDKCRET
jgi:hypothetical protein